MLHSPLPPRFTQEEKERLCALALIGCDRETACRCVGRTPEELNSELQQDAEFSRQLHQAEGKAEVHHMRNLHVATQDSKQWRASVWWLEHYAAPRTESKEDDNFTLDQWQDFLTCLADLLFVEISDKRDAQRVLERLSDMAAFPSNSQKHPLDGQNAEEAVGE